MSKFSLIQMLGRGAPVIDIVDVGAMWLGAENVAYRALLKEHRARVIGFEPVRAECDRLNAMSMTGHTYLPHFIGDGDERTFVLTNEPYTSSLYEPDLEFCGRFNMLAEVMQPVERTRVQTKRLDDIAEIANIDFLKVDVQGAEIDVFRGAERLLGGVVAIQTEVNFAPQYKGAPLFAEVDQHLRKRGFAFHTFSTVMGRAFKPLVVGKDPARSVRQILWGDAVYVRDYTRLGDLDADKLLRLAVILHEVYGSVDLAALALRHRDAKTEANLWSTYMTRLLGGRQPPPPPAL